MIEVDAGDSCAKGTLQKIASTIKSIGHLLTSVGPRGCLRSDMERFTSQKWCGRGSRCKSEVMVEVA